MEPCGFSPTSTSRAQPPQAPATLAPFSELGQGEFRKLSRGFLLLEQPYRILSGKDNIVERK